MAPRPPAYRSLPRGSSAEFQNPSPSLWKVAAKVVGMGASEELRATIGAAIESEGSVVIVHRPDLSYLPE
ncbi:MAG: hypothetical protein V2I67_16825 [Thermoanaerobaculales bacterium]|nr:hypothetical protein [Thermoanaerobaculales bacterium]